MPKTNKINNIPLLVYTLCTFLPKAMLEFSTDKTKGSELISNDAIFCETHKSPIKMLQKNKKKTIATEKKIICSWSIRT